MAFFTDLTTSLKQKWLEFFQVNRSWIARQMESEYVATPDGGKRPSSYLILGVVSALEPQLAELLIPFTKLNPDINSLIDVLELNFDPERSQGNPSIAINPHTPLTANAEEMDAFMGMLNDEAPQELSELSLVEVVDRTAPQAQQNIRDRSNPGQSEVDNTWLDELNQETTLESEPEPEQARTRQQKPSEGDEVSRLFPDF